MADLGRFALDDTLSLGLAANYALGNPVLSTTAGDVKYDIWDVSGGAAVSPTHSGNYTVKTVTGAANIALATVNLTTGLGFLEGRAYLVSSLFKLANTAAFHAKGDHFVIDSGFAGVRGQMRYGTVAVKTSQTVFDCTEITDATTNHFKNRLIMFIDGTAAGEVQEISSYQQIAGPKGEFTMTNAFAATIAVGNRFVVI